MPPIYYPHDTSMQGRSRWRVRRRRWTAMRAPNIYRAEVWAPELGEAYHCRHPWGAIAMQLRHRMLQQLLFRQGRTTVPLQVHARHWVSERHRFREKISNKTCQFGTGNKCGTSGEVVKLPPPFAPAPPQQTWSGPSRAPLSSLFFVVQKQRGKEVLVFISILYGSFQELECTPMQEEYQSVRFTVRCLYAHTAHTI